MVVVCEGSPFFLVCFQFLGRLVVLCIFLLLRFRFLLKLLRCTLSLVIIKNVLCTS
jgi:hypothetical protein